MKPRGLFTRLLFLFVQVIHTPCGEPGCRCRQHELLHPTRLAWWIVGLLMFAQLAYCAGVLRR